MTIDTRLDDFGGLLDWEKLQPWIEASALPGSGPVTDVQKLPGGSQNNLFVMKRQDAEFILRRPPLHLRDNSNSTMLREARLLRALAGSDVPHADLYDACEDDTVIGATFYTMRPLEGFTPHRALPAVYADQADWRRAMGPELIMTAAAMSRIDYKAVGLETYGKPDDWHVRQVDRWRSQLDGYRAMPGYGGSDLPHVDEVGRWLADNVPADRRIGIIHGDYQFANVMFSYRGPRISGLIDWELSTLGDPMLDLGWVLASWWEEGDPEGKTPLLDPWRNFQPRRDLVALYGDLTGRDMGAMPWFFVLACYKLGCILEGTYARACAGKADKAVGDFVHGYATWLLNKAMQVKAAGAI